MTHEPLIESVGYDELYRQIKAKGYEIDVRDVKPTLRCRQWARQFGQLAGVNVPLYSAEHFYIVTDRIEGVHPMLPVMRDPDGFIYYKEEVGGLVMGGFEPKAKPWRVDPKSTKQASREGSMRVMRPL